jgi:hypothetical protein
MMDVYISHLGEEPLQSMKGSESCTPGTLREVLKQIDARHPGFFDLVAVPDRLALRSSVLIYKNI